MSSRPRRPRSSGKADRHNSSGDDQRRQPLDNPPDGQTSRRRLRGYLETSYLRTPTASRREAIAINAPAAAVWPWLAQMGPLPRGGAYTYDWIENRLGLDMHSTDRILPEFQHPEIGDMIGFGSNRMRLERVEPEHVLAWRSEDGNWVWTFVLDERDGQTRLVSRNRFRLPTLGARIVMLPVEPGSLVMERKMLHGIKQRAEQLTSAPPHRCMD
jgi:hypothetical protein